MLAKVELGNTTIETGNAREQTSIPTIVGSSARLELPVSCHSPSPDFFAHVLKALVVLLLLVLVNAFIFALFGIILIVVFVIIVVLTLVFIFALFLSVGLGGVLTTATHSGHSVRERRSATEAARDAINIVDCGRMAPQEYTPVREL
jgi:hypothetical protein